MHINGRRSDTGDMDEIQDNHWDDADWDDRRLCSDGNCIGVVGSDGRCKECGLRHDGASAPDPDDAPGDAVDAEDMDEADAVEPEGTGPESGADPQSDAVTGGEEDDGWDRRTLCDDGNCIGVIGPDGRCKVCQKKAGS